MKTGKVDFILDSGAYSAWKTNTPLTVDEYVNFIKQYEDCIDHAVNLDQIPGHWGQKPSQAEVEASAEYSWKNLIIMEQSGIKALPVFHQGERRYWLEKMIDHGCQYIGISPANNRTTDQKRVWLDETFGYLCGSKGFPTVKTHGFGVTSVPLLFRYPWASADSITWLLLAAYGSVMVPDKNPDGTYNYCTSPLGVFLTNEAAMDKYERGTHFWTMGKETQAYVREYLNSLGFEPEGLTEKYETRARVNCAYFCELAKAYTIQPYHQQRQSIFQIGEKASGLGSEKRLWDHINMVFTVTLSGGHSEILTHYNQRNRLLSYWYFKGGKGFDIRSYVATGLMPPTNKRPPAEKKSKPKVAKYRKCADEITGLSLSAALHAAANPIEILEEVEAVAATAKTRRKPVLVDDDNDDMI